MTNLSSAHTVLVFGGTFDPPTVAHVMLPTLVAKAIGADAIAYIPAAMSPFKTAAKTTPTEHRLAMLRLAVGEVKGACVLTDEIDRASGDRPIYTIDTVEALRKRLPASVTLRLLIGSDHLRAFDMWRDHERLAALAEPAAMVRPPDTREAVLDALPAGFDRATWAPRLVDVPAMDVSATEVRRRVRAGESIAGLVSPVVERYIREHHLYADEPSEGEST